MRIGLDILFEKPLTSAGGESYLLGILPALSKINAKKHELYLFVNQGNAKFYKQVIGHDDFTLIKLPGSNKHKWFRFLTQQILIPYYVKKYNIDVVGFLGNTSTLFLPCASTLHIRSLHCFWAPDQLLWARRQFLKIMIKLSTKKADLIIANSNYLKEAVIELLNPNCETKLVPHGVDHNIFQPLQADEKKVLNNKIDHEYGITNPYLLFVSTLYPYKNADKIIRSFANLVKTKNIKHQLVIVGGDYEGQINYLRNLATNLGVGSKVVFLGHISNRNRMRELYSLAHIFLYPSSFETFGQPILEAMACGTPVIGSNISSVPEIIGDAGISTDPNKIEQLSKTIYHLINNKKANSDLIAKGLKHSGQFKWERTAQETIEAYERAVFSYQNNNS